MEILVGGGVAALLAALVGGGSKAFGIELPVLASVKRQALMAIVVVVLVGLGLLSGVPPKDGEAMASGSNQPAPVTGQAEAVSAAPLPQSSPPSRQRPDVPNIVGLPYPAARQFLIQNSWAPVNTSTNPKANSDLGFRAEEMFDAGYAEAVSCSGTGAAPCLFRYQSPGGFILEVTTVGEDIAQAKVNGSTVVDCSAVPRPDGCWAGSGSGR